MHDPDLSDDDFELEAAAIERYWVTPGQGVFEQRLIALEPHMAEWEQRGEARLSALSKAFGYMQWSLDHRGRTPNSDPMRWAALREDVRSIGWPRAERLAEVGDAMMVVDADSLRASRDLLLSHGPLLADPRPAAERFWTDHRLCIIHSQLGAFEDGLSSALGCNALARQTGFDDLLRRATKVGIYFFLSFGDVQGAEKLLVSSDPDFRPIVAKNVSVDYNYLLTWVLGEHFDIAFEQLENWKKVNQGLWPKEYSPAVAYVQAKQGQMSQALALLNSMDFNQDANKLPPQLLANHAWLSARTWLLAGEPTRAALQVTQMFEKAESAGWQLSPLNRTQLYHVLADANEALGDLRGTVKALRNAQVACVAWVANSMRSQLMTLCEQTQTRGKARITRRLEALDGAVTRASEQPPSESLRSTPFIAHVTHEIRNSVSGVVGMTSLLALSKLDERQQRLVSLTQESAQMLVGLCNDLLDLAKIEAGHFELSPETTDVATLVQRMADQFRERTVPGVALECQVEDNLPPWLLVDPLRLRQLVMNMLSNAVKFTSKGMVTLAVGWQHRSSLTGRLRVAVTDTGPGMSAEQRSKLFEEFYQVNGARDAKRGGTGLGLALCRALVQRMDGQINVDSEPGRGSRFWVELPLSVSAPNPS